MKARKLKLEDTSQPGTSEIPSESQPPPKPRPLTLSQTIRKEFEVFAQTTFPDEYAEPDDQKVLWATWLAATRQTAAQISMSTINPFLKTANDEFGVVMQKSVTCTLL